MTVAIQQPEHAPWMGFFNKMSQVDLFVLLDNVQFKKRYFENRNRIRTAQGSQWVTVPVLSRGRYTQEIREVEIDRAHSWQRKYVSSIAQAYGKAPCFPDHMGALESLLTQPWERLVDLNFALITFLASVCGIQTRVLLSSSLDTGDKRGSDLILDICAKTGASIYVSGPDGRNYLSLDEFSRAGIRVVYHDFVHPTYPQVYHPFTSHMSLVDFVFNVADTALVRGSYGIPFSVSG